MNAELRHFGRIMNKLFVTKVIMFAPAKNNADESAHVMIICFGIKVRGSEVRAEGLEDADKEPGVTVDKGGRKVITMRIDKIEEVKKEGVMGARAGKVTAKVAKKVLLVATKSVVGAMTVEIKSRGGNVGGLIDVASAEVETATCESGVKDGLDRMLVFSIAFVKVSAGGKSNGERGEIEVGHEVSITSFT